MSLRDELLNPIAGANPGGVDLRYDPLFDKIKEARRADVDAPQGEWTTTLKTSDWALVIKLSKEALSTKSKDLQIAAWLTEAMLKREGFGGLAAGLDVLGGLVEQFWDHLYPEIDDGDAEMRAAPLEWIDRSFDVSIRTVPLDRAGHDSLQIKESRIVPTEAAAYEDTLKGNARTAAIAAGKLTPEDADAAFNITPKAWMKTLVADLTASLSNLSKLNDVSQEKFGDVAPSFSKIKETLEDVHRTAAQMLKRKLEIEPDPVEAGGGESADAAAGVDDGSAAAPASARGGPLAAEPTSRDDAASRVVGAARYLRATDPFNPAAYTLLRGFRWGELRVNPGVLNPKLLEAPPTNLRVNLKGLLLDARWPELLEACETVMGSPHGRGWIDLQRYTLTAVDALGESYVPVANAMRGALRSLLADLPQLVDMTLMDDTPTANVETLAWLRGNDLLPRAEASSFAEEEGAPEDNGGRNPVMLAMSEVRSGRTDRAIALLMREAGREKTSRGRFLVQAQLAKIMVDAGHDNVALPVLEQLIADIESHKLEEWEAGEMVAAPMALMYRVLEKTEGDAGTRQSLYLRICRLDPIQAISFTPT
jgi:type VI secretion system protein ImpA